VNVTASVVVPVEGAVAGVVHVKLPGADPNPPLNVDEARVCPKVMALALGQVVTVGAALFTMTPTDPAAVL
jgi:hypothetical protein